MASKWKRVRKPLAELLAIIALWALVVMWINHTMEKCSTLC